MWRQLLGGPHPPQPSSEEEEEEEEENVEAPPLPPKAPPPKPTGTSSGFFDPPKLPPSPRTKRTDKKTAEVTSDNAEPTKETESHLEQVDQSTLSPPPSPKASPEIDSPELPKEPVWATSPASAKQNNPSMRHIPVDSDTERNLDMREARLGNSEFFIDGIKMIEAERQKEIADKPETSMVIQSSQNQNGIAVFVRKQPMDETENGEDYDVIRVESAAAATPVAVVYNTQMEWTTKTKTIKPVTFAATAVFDENKTSADVYYQAVKPLVEKTKNGGISTVLMYGQSGSGKSHTMASVLSMAARDTFTALPLNYTVKISYIEIVGKECRDLLDETPSPVRIADNEDGSVRFVNARLVTVSTPEDLQDAMVNAKKRRTYKSNTDEPNSGDSSLSHAVCRIIVVPPNDAPTQPGSLTLVDCAGTEQRIGHDRRLQAARAEINASLWALKQCIRNKKSCENSSPIENKNPPYEYSTLTRILRESLEKKNASFHIIATISSKATDTEHTIDTLLTVSNVVEGSIDELTAEQQATASSSSNDAENIPPPPKAWDRSQLIHWLVKKNLIIQKNAHIPEDMTGRRIMRLSKKELQDTFYGQDDTTKADLLYRCLRAETDRIARLDVKRRMAVEIAARKGKATK